MPARIALATTGARKLGGGFLSSILVFVLIYWAIGLVKS